MTGSVVRGALTALWRNVLLPGFTVELPEVLFNRRRRALIRFSDHYSLCDRPARRQLYDLAMDVQERALPGDFVEMGVARGGTAAILAGSILTTPERRLWLYDSFEGLPEPSDLDGKKADAYAGGRTSGELRSIGMCVGSREEVEALLLDQVGFPPSRLSVVPGWFQHTAFSTRPDQIALLHLDGDWYESIRVCLTALYDRVTPGGWVVLDDYFVWPGCKLATDEFLTSRGLSPTIKKRGHHQAHFQKPPDPPPT